MVQEMPGEVLVYDLSSHSAHCLNETAAFVWNHCDGSTKPAKIAALMSKKWQKQVSEDVVWHALKHLRKANLLTEPQAWQADRMDSSRRAAVRKLALATAIAVPMVTSIVSPTAAAAASVPPVCLTCISRGEGQFFPSACTEECKDVHGTCYDNSGCGAGQAFPTCITCLACAAAAVVNGGTAKSWKHPGSLNCAP